jgi:hypothetical protein
MNPQITPKIYHITHYQNLESIIKSGAIFSDSYCLKNSKDHTKIGMSEIKRRRLEEIEVKCHPGTRVGEYVPFYFCPRSIMLYLMYKGNHPDLKYVGGQEPIVHIQADLVSVVEWAKKNMVKWAFSDRNAGTYYAEFYNEMRDLDKINWEAVTASDFRQPLIKEGKQAEFLLYKSFPFDLIESIGVINAEIQSIVKNILQGTALVDKVQMRPDWYF